MDAMEALTTRFSIKPAMLGEPAPDGAALEAMLRAGASAPDHGRLRPWRFLIIRGGARERLGEVFVEALRRRRPDADQEMAAKERAKPLRAPLIVAVAATVQKGHKIPEVEQVLSAGAAAQNVLLAAHAQGFGGHWITGDPAYDPYVKAALGLGPDDVLAGFLYLGSPQGTPPPGRHADHAEHTTEWREPVAI
ncbi:MAG TPA: nitroreductase [Geminicoccaceae bacterium]|nr:nitroreductase [Geminicoccaceae bacterium]